MRYYRLILNTSVAEIKENARVNLRAYGYDNTFAAVNNYMENTKVMLSKIEYAIIQNNSVINGNIKVESSNLSISLNLEQK